MVHVQRWGSEGTIAKTGNAPKRRKKERQPLGEEITTCITFDMHSLLEQTLV